MSGSGDALRIVVVLGGAMAALASATSQSSQAPQAQYTPHAQPQAQAQPQQTYTPCEYACGQVSRCNIAPYDACVAQCRHAGSEQQPGGVEHLHLVSRTSCEQLQTAMQAAGQGAQPGTAVSSAPLPATSAAGAGAIEADYEVPLGYTSAQHGAMVVFAPITVTEKVPCAYGLSPARRSSGSLENDAVAALLEPLPGWQRKDDRLDVMRGTSPTGWSYYWVRTDVMRLSGGSYEYASAMAMAFPGADNRVNILWGYGALGHCTADDASFARLFHGLRPRNWRPDGGAALVRDLQGLWRNSQDYGMTQYRFRADGGYEYAIHATNQVGYLERTSTGVRDGSYAVRDDGVLVITPDRKDRRVQKLRVRVFDAYKLGKWWRTMATLAEGGTDYREIEYERIDE